MTSRSIEDFASFSYSAFPQALYRRFVDLYVRPYAASVGHCLDLGCGSGGLIQELAPLYACRFVGVDLSPASMEACRSRLSGLPPDRVQLVLEDAATFARRPERSAAFDLLVSYSVLHFLPGETSEKFQLLAGLTRPGAILAVDALARVPWNRVMFGVVRLLVRLELFPLALRLLGPLVGPSFPKAFLEELGQMKYLRHLRYADFIDVAFFRCPEFQSSFELLRLDLVPQDGLLTGRKLRLALRRRPD